MVNLRRMEFLLILIFIYKNGLPLKLQYLTITISEFTSFFSLAVGLKVYLRHSYLNKDFSFSSFYSRKLGNYRKVVYFLWICQRKQSPNIWIFIRKNQFRDRLTNWFLRHSLSYLGQRNTCANGMRST